MRSVDPGHSFQLQAYQPHRSRPEARPEDVGQDIMLTFRKEVGPGYPGNQPPMHSGTSTQEVLRALLARMQYVQGQADCRQNANVIQLLRRAIYDLEERAAERRGVEYWKEWQNDYDCWLNNLEGGTAAIEAVAACQTCGHIFCRSSHEHT